MARPPRSPPASAGWRPAGLPLGVQIVGAWGEDARVLQVGAWIEARLGWSARALDAL